MPLYISLLRGINVSGKNKILMTDLKMLYESLSFKNVTSYIQSGNVLFEASSANEEELAKLISAKIKAVYDFNVPVLVKSIDKFQQAVTDNPFIKEKDIQVDKIHLTFLASVPNENAVATLKEIKTEDSYCIVGAHVYLYCPSGYGNTKLTNTTFEKKLGVKATTRNWKTCNEIINIATTKYSNT